MRINSYFFKEGGFKFMKNKRTPLLLCFLMLFILSPIFSITASAEVNSTVSIDHNGSKIQMHFNIPDINGDVASIVNYNNSAVVPYDTTGTLTIPRSIEYNNKSYTVTSIGYVAFDGCTLLEGVILPDTVTTIGQNAFSHCSSLTSINLENVTTIGHRAFLNCRLLTSINLKNVESIESNAFFECTDLISVNLENVTTIGLQAFENCSNLKVSLPPSVTFIDASAFFNVHTVYLEGNYSANFNSSAFTGVDYLYFNDYASGWDAPAFDTAALEPSTHMSHFVANNLTNVSTSNPSNMILIGYDYLTNSYSNPARENYTATLSCVAPYNAIDLSINTISASLKEGVDYTFEPSTGNLTIFKDKITETIIINATAKIVATPTPAQTPSNTTTLKLYGLNVENGSGDGSYAPGTAVTITADTIEGKTFSHWTYDFSSGIADEKSASTTFIMPNTGVNLKANYVFNASTEAETSAPKETFSIKIETEGDGKVLLNGEEKTLVDAKKNSSPTFVFSASENWEISDILIDGESVGTLGEYTINNIEKNTSIKAVFIETKDISDTPTTEDTLIETEQLIEPESSSFSSVFIIGGVIIASIIGVSLLKKRNKE